MPVECNLKSTRSARADQCALSLSLAFGNGSAFRLTRRFSSSAAFSACALAFRMRWRHQHSAHISTTRRYQATVPRECRWGAPTLSVFSSRFSVEKQQIDLLQYWPFCAPLPLPSSSSAALPLFLLLLSGGRGGSPRKQQEQQQCPPALCDVITTEVCTRSVSAYSGVFYYLEKKEKKIATLIRTQRRAAGNGWLHHIPHCTAARLHGSARSSASRDIHRRGQS